MPIYYAPVTAEDRLFILEETKKYCDAEILAGRPSPIKTPTLTGSTSFTILFKPLVANLSAALGVRSREVSESNTAQAFLETSIRDYIEVLKRRTHRKTHDAAVLVNHGLPENGDAPVLSSWADAKQTASALIAGDALSATTYGPMANPSAAELQTALTAATEEHDDIAPADSVVQAAQNAIAAQADTAEFWISEIRYDALDSVRREDAPGQRRLLRKLGYKFKVLPGETPEEPTDQPLPTPTP